MRRVLARSASPLLLLTFLAGCGGDGTGPGEGPVASITVSPSNRALTYPEETVQLTATAKDSKGTTVPGVSFTWTSSDMSVVSVDGSGLATAVDGGQVTVTAQADGVSGSAIVRVTGPLDLTFLRTNWTGEAIAHDEGGDQTLDLAGAGTSVSGGFGTRLRLVVGTGADIRELVFLGGLHPSFDEIFLGLADSYRGTFVVSQGVFDGAGGATFDSKNRLGNDRVERVRMDEFRSESFDLLVDESSDGGATWTPAWTLHLQKTGDAPGAATGTSTQCADEHYADFDFWAGHWTVTAGGGTAGTNLILPLASKCGITENWSDSQGGTGVSLNMYEGWARARPRRIRAGPTPGWPPPPGRARGRPSP